MKTNLLKTLKIFYLTPIIFLFVFLGVLFCSCDNPSKTNVEPPREVFMIESPSEDKNTFKVLSSGEESPILKVNLYYAGDTSPYEIEVPASAIVESGGLNFYEPGYYTPTISVQNKTTILKVIVVYDYDNVENFTFEQNYCNSNGQINSISLYSNRTAPAGAIVRYENSLPKFYDYDKQNEHIVFFGENFGFGCYFEIEESLPSGKTLSLFDAGGGDTCERELTYSFVKNGGKRTLDICTYSNSFANIFEDTSHLFTIKYQTENPNTIKLLGKNFEILENNTLFEIVDVGSEIPLSLGTSQNLISPDDNLSAIKIYKQNKALKFIYTKDDEIVDKLYHYEKGGNFYTIYDSITDKIYSYTIGVNNVIDNGNYAVLSRLSNAMHTESLPTSIYLFENDIAIVNFEYYSLTFDCQSYKDAGQNAFMVLYSRTDTSINHTYSAMVVQIYEGDLADEFFFDWYIPSTTLYQPETYTYTNENESITFNTYSIQNILFADVVENVSNATTKRCSRLIAINDGKFYYMDKTYSINLYNLVPYVPFETYRLPNEHAFLGGGESAVQINDTQIVIGQETYYYISNENPSYISVNVGGYNYLFTLDENSKRINFFDLSTLGGEMTTYEGEESGIAIVFEVCKIDNTNRYVQIFIDDVLGGVTDDFEIVGEDIYAFGFSGKIK